MSEQAVYLTLPPEAVEAVARRAAEIVLERLEPAAAPEEASPYMSIAEAGEYLRSPRSRVDDLLSQGRLRRFKAGRRTLVLRSEVEALVRPESRR